MRILDEESDRALSRITLLLRPSEARELVSALETLLRAGEPAHHEHISNSDFDKEVTVAMYDEEQLDQFSERCQLLIASDR